MASKEGSRSMRKMTLEERKAFFERMERESEREKKAISEIVRLIRSERNMRKHFPKIVVPKPPIGKRPPRTH